LSLTLYNTLSRKKERFEPLDPAHVRMYVCGPTVYDYAHIGNARPVIVFDVLYRLLKRLYPKVTYVRNITDVDDKINARAAEDYPDLPLNEAIAKVTAETEQQFHDDVKALGCLEPDVEPRATGHITEMIAMIGKLIEQGFAYEAEGHVLFEVGKMADYGKLSGRSVDDMIAGARVEVAPYKKDPMDFVLWKPSGDDAPGWDSPWGLGRPGWHIECSAMSDKHLETPFDIHGGGIDLVFPHHENEIAQSRCCFGTDRMAQVWMHNGYLQVEGEKMSKSLGNFITVRQMLDNWHNDRWPGEALRYNMLRTHYRQPLDWTHEGLDRSHQELYLWYKTFHERGIKAGQIPSVIVDALSDDLNTRKVLTEFRNFQKRNDYAALRAGLEFMGFSGEFEKIKRRHILTVAGRAKILVSEQDVRLRSSEIDRLVSERDEARKNKDFAKSDQIRDQLNAMGIEIHDGPDGTTWEVAR
jgi:cysteinyl-tRNA synthetase